MAGSEVTLVLDKPGAYNHVPEKDYHADPCPQPSASCGILEILLGKTPLHAYSAHPRLGRIAEDDDKEKPFNKGTAVHQMLVSDTEDVVIINALNYKTKEAQLLKMQAIDGGKLPLLDHQYDACLEIVDAIKDRLDTHKQTRGILQANKEVAAIGFDRHWARIRADMALPELIQDIKITGINATPEEWGSKHAINMNYHFRAAWYRMVWKMATGYSARYQFVVVDGKFPFDVAVFECDPHATELGFREASYAWDIWRRCMDTNIWPGYSEELQYITVPAYKDYQSAEILARHSIVTERMISELSEAKPAQLEQTQGLIDSRTGEIGS